MSDQSATLDEQFTLVLSSPIVAAGTTFTEIKLREPLVRDLRILSGSMAQKDPVTATNQLYSQLTDGVVPAEVFERMKVRDMRKISAWFRPFTQEESDTN